jgi:dihydrofolate synthase/folylpolyglutamate synthase
MEQINQVPRKNLHMIWGMVSDKDAGSIWPLLPGEGRYYFTRSSVPRSRDENKLLQEAAGYGLHGEAYPTVKDAYQAAMDHAAEEDLLFTGGSTFVVADLLASLGY